MGFFFFFFPLPKQRCSGQGESGRGVGGRGLSDDFNNLPPVFTLEWTGWIVVEQRCGHSFRSTDLAELLQLFPSPWSSTEEPEIITAKCSAVDKERLLSYVIARQFCSKQWCLLTSWGPTPVLQWALMFFCRSSPCLAVAELQLLFLFSFIYY